MLNKTGNKGFTLVETLVAMGLFAIVMSIAVGGFVKAMRTQAQIVSLVSANSNASLMIEQVAREIRTGYGFSCVQDGGVCKVLMFTNFEKKEVEYSLIEEDGVGYVAKVTDSSEPVRVTAENIDVEYLDFKLLGELSGDGAPTRVTMIIGVAPAARFGEISITRLQTTVSAREVVD